MLGRVLQLLQGGFKEEDDDDDDDEDEDESHELSKRYPRLILFKKCIVFIVNWRKKCIIRLVMDGLPVICSVNLCIILW
jgi:hypothetical protein